MKSAMSWYHLGLRGRLFTAFGVVAALTVLASSSAIVSDDNLGRSRGAIADSKNEAIVAGDGECLRSSGRHVERSREDGAERVKLADSGLISVALGND